MRMDAIRSIGKGCLVALILFCLVIGGEARALRLPHTLFEKQVEDVEVCQSSVCTKLREQILREAFRCRSLANFKQRQMNIPLNQTANSCTLFQKKNFRTSKGECSAAVRMATQRAGIDEVVLRDNAYGMQKNGTLEKAGFVNMRWKYDENNAPLGAILIYVGGLGHSFGHIEVRVNPHLYCSDHCSDKPISQHNARTERRYKLSGVYVPFSSSIETVNLGTRTIAAKSDAPAAAGPAVSYRVSRR
jgi:hypothetical protein